MAFPFVTSLELAIGGEQDVGGLQVTVRHPAGVEVLHGPQDLTRNVSKRGRNA